MAGRWAESHHMRLVPLILAAVLVAAAPAQATPAACKRATVKAAIKHNGGLVDAGFGQFICRDVTADGRKDALFTVLSGGTAGATHFGVFSRAHLVLYEEGYKVQVHRDSASRFTLEQPFYGKNDPNCCPSAFDYTPYKWVGKHFKAGHSERSKTQRF